MKAIKNFELVDFDYRPISRGEDGKTWWVCDVLIHALQTHAATNKDACYRAFDAAGRLHKQRRADPIHIEDDDVRVTREAMSSPKVWPMVYTPAMRALEDATASATDQE